MPESKEEPVRADLRIDASPRDLIRAVPKGQKPKD